MEGACAREWLFGCWVSVSIDEAGCVSGNGGVRHFFVPSMKPVRFHGEEQRHRHLAS
jgi:hypothetical protein